MPVYQMTELSIHKLVRDPNIIYFIWSIYITANDKIGQTPAEFDNVIDNIFKIVCGMNVQKVNKFMLATYDPTHLQLPCVIPC